MEGVTTISERLATVRAAIDDACADAGRSSGAVKLIAVSKGVASPMIAEAIRAGQADFGENYIQDALVKMKDLAHLGADWHMIGQLQSNKAAKAARNFTYIHSLDSVSSARSISKAMLEDSRESAVLIQVKLGGGPRRGGVDADDVAEFAAAVTAQPGIRVEGLMGVAPVDTEPRRHFARLREILESLRGLRLPRAPLTELSAGMSRDYREAIAEGATMVRIGSAIFGERSGPALRGSNL